MSSENTAINSEGCRLFHFPLCHATNFSHLLVQVFAGIGIGIFSIYFMTLFQILRTSFAAVISIMALLSITWAVFSLLLLATKVCRPCDCGHQMKNGKVLLQPILLFSLLVAELALSGFVCQIGVLDNLGQPFISSTLLGALSFIAPAIVLQVLNMQGKIAAFESKIQS